MSDSNTCCSVAHGSSVADSGCAIGTEHRHIEPALEVHYLFLYNGSEATSSSSLCRIFDNRISIFDHHHHLAPHACATVTGSPVERASYRDDRTAHDSSSHAQCFVQRPAVCDLDCS
jgi:hypothetical protein